MCRGRVLHVLSQRPGLTGSGVTVDSMIRAAAAAGWDQHVVVGVPADDAAPAVGGLPPARVFPLVFERGDLDFPVPGMSDVMPYRSTRFSAMTPGQLDRYRGAWREHLARVISETRPDAIHAHHVWIVGALLKGVAPNVPVVSHCHATGLRQAELCPHLAPAVRAGCARNDRFVVLHQGHAAELAHCLGVAPERITVVGSGFREDLFHPPAGAAPRPPALLYAGKYSNSKGLPWLLDALEGLAPALPELVLHVAGSGAGAEAAAIRARMERLAPRVTLHGSLGQPELADLMRRVPVFVLPSFYEGLPLVLVEAAACACRLVATALPGVRDELAPQLGEMLELVTPPHLRTIDQPEEDDLPAFVMHLQAAIQDALGKPEPGDSASRVAGFTWGAVFRKIETVWKEAIGA